MSELKEFPLGSTFNLSGVPDTVKAVGFADDTNPFIPSRSDTYVFRKEFIRDLNAFLRSPFGDALMITGPTGSGKTSGVTEAAARVNWPVQQVTCHGRMELGDLIGQYTLSSQRAGQQPEMTFVYGPLPVAMREGHILLLNEVDMMEPSELSGLNDILEGRPLVISQNGGEVIHPHPMFRVVVTANSVGTGDDSGLYQGVLMQNIAAMDRYRLTEVGYPEAEVEKGILAKAAPGMADVLTDAMIRVANDVRKLFLGGESVDGTERAEGSIAITMSTRTLVRWAKLTLQFRGADNALEYALDRALLIRARPEEAEAIRRITKDVFGDLWDNS